MHPHLTLVGEFQQAFSGSIDIGGESAHLADMELIVRQAVLMEEGAELFRAFKSGEMAEVLAGLVNLAYASVCVIVELGGEIADDDSSWHNDGFVISIVRTLSEKIAACASGKSADYSRLYHLCERLARDFLNADFDQAFKAVHNSRMNQVNGRQVPASSHFKTPDLSDYLFE
jgi:hypothetical protein